MQNFDSALFRKEKNIKITKKDLILELLKKRKARTQKRLSRLKQQVNGGPQGSLRVVTKHNKKKPSIYQYYLITKKNDTQGTYLKREQTTLATAIAQKDVCPQSLS